MVDQSTCKMSPPEPPKLVHSMILPASPMVQLMLNPTANLKVTPLKLIVALLQASLPVLKHNPQGWCLRTNCQNKSPQDRAKLGQMGGFPHIESTE